MKLFENFFFFRFFSYHKNSAPRDNFFCIRLISLLTCYIGYLDFLITFRLRFKGTICFQWKFNFSARKQTLLVWTYQQETGSNGDQGRHRGWSSTYYLPLNYTVATAVPRYVSGLCNREVSCYKNAYNNILSLWWPYVVTCSTGISFIPGHSFSEFCIFLSKIIKLFFFNFHSPKSCKISFFEYLAQSFILRFLNLSTIFFVNTVFTFVETVLIFSTTLIDKFCYFFSFNKDF